MTCERCKEAERKRALAHYGAMLDELNRPSIGNAWRWFCYSQDARIDRCLVAVAGVLGTICALITLATFIADRMGILPK